MFIVNRNLLLLKLPNFVKYSTLNRSEPFHEVTSNFTEDEQKKILNTLNKSNAEQLLKFSVPQGKIENLEKWKSKKGSFKTLRDVLEVEGLGEKMLEKLYERIITENITAVPVKTKTKPILSPPMTGVMLNNLKTAVGINLNHNGISWAKINRENNKLNDLNFQNFSSLPDKLHLKETLDLALSAIQKIPAADVYILEAPPSRPQDQSQMGSYMQQLEFSSMLLALLNTSRKHNIGSLHDKNTEKPQNTIENKVFHIKSNVPARLFKTIIGNERVSAVHNVTALMTHSPKCNLSCTPISVEKELCDAFISKPPANRDLLCQALMLVISFMDLCVYRNPASLSELTRGKRK